jgi:hypothetical protein
VVEPSVGNGRCVVHCGTARWGEAAGQDRASIITELKWAENSVAQDVEPGV